MSHGTHSEAVDPAIICAKPDAPVAVDVSRADVVAIQSILGRECYEFTFGDTCLGRRAFRSKECPESSPEMENTASSAKAVRFAKCPEFSIFKADETAAVGADPQCSVTILI